MVADFNIDSQYSEESIQVYDNAFDIQSTNGQRLSRTEATAKFAIEIAICVIQRVNVLYNHSHKVPLPMK